MTEQPQGPNNNNRLKAFLLRITAGSLFSVLMGAYFLLAIKGAGVNLDSLPPLDVIGMFGLFFTIVSVTIWLIGKLPLKVVLVVFALALTFSVISLWSLFSHLFGFAVVGLAYSSSELDGVPEKCPNCGYLYSRGVLPTHIPVCMRRTQPLISQAVETREAPNAA
jgi:hypothetical protein